MNREHWEALQRIWLALDHATNVGALDKLSEGWSHPDTINRFCDDLETALKNSVPPINESPNWKGPPLIDNPGGF